MTKSPSETRAGADDEDFSRETSQAFFSRVLGLILITIFIKGLADGIKHIQSGFDPKPRGAESNSKGKV